MGLQAPYDNLLHEGKARVYFSHAINSRDQKLDRRTCLLLKVFLGIEEVHSSLWNIKLTKICTERL